MMGFIGYCVYKGDECRFDCSCGFYSHTSV